MQRVIPYAIAAFLPFSAYAGRTMDILLPSFNQVISIDLDLMAPRMVKDASGTPRIACARLARAEIFESSQFRYEAPAGALVVFYPSGDLLAIDQITQGTIDFHGATAEASTTKFMSKGIYDYFNTARDCGGNGVRVRFRQNGTLENFVHKNPVPVTINPKLALTCEPGTIETHTNGTLKACNLPGARKITLNGTPMEMELKEFDDQGRIRWVESEKKIGSFAIAGCDVRFSFHGATLDEWEHATGGWLVRDMKLPDPTTGEIYSDTLLRGFSACHGTFNVWSDPTPRKSAQGYMLDDFTATPAERASIAKQICLDNGFSSSNPHPKSENVYLEDEYVYDPILGASVRIKKSTVKIFAPKCFKTIVHDFTPAL